MAYVAVKGGREAIEHSIAALDYRKNRVGVPELSIEQIRHGMHFLVDRVMGEGSLYAPDLAAKAIQQAAGDCFEAAFIIRAYRATLPRTGYSLPANTESIRIIRRISAAFKDIPGGQILGPSVDYTLRLLDFAASEDPEEERRRVRAFLIDAGLCADEAQTFPKVISLLRAEKLVNDRDVLGRKDAAMSDVTRDSIQFPASRSASLQTMARGETGGMLALAYSNMRGYGSTHPTIGELRVGYLPVRVNNPLTQKPVTIGEVLVTEAEIISKIRSSKSTPRFDVGYGLCFGHNETKAIAMATLDVAMRTPTPGYPSEDSEFVLTHIDGIEAMGFANHFKLPHYVTFQSSLDRLRRSQERFAEAKMNKEPNA